ncbi:GNAT family N-acetyltransferase [Clostridium botulinum]|nr:GNAT family N-acetyltransferase [Clostridium botulinum]NFS54583.1 GNAT family N-acetyltransferase [Clostridium botulinum]NFT17553.1 GNAT family N-acetyltransferase [Clostridium botulinum]
MISIKEIDAQNVFDVCELTTNQNGVGTTMEKYLCCNATSIAESKYYPKMCPKGIYLDNTLIGFFMYERTSDTPYMITICRFMLDYKFQHKGLGRKAFEGILNYLKEQGVSKVALMIDEANVIAKTLYLSFGFTFSGKVEKDEHYYDLIL